MTIDAENGVSDPTQSFTLTVENPPATTAATTAAAATATPATASLPFTGGTAWVWVLIGLAFLAAGALAVNASRRPRN